MRSRTTSRPTCRSISRINPYQGCEHGCIYCFARPSHAYWNLGPGLDFETRIFYKPGLARLLDRELRAKGYVCKPINLGANTDPYQPAEREHGTTRELLEVLLLHRHPVTIVTKGALVLRDIDLLTQLAAQRLVAVMVSLTTLDDELKRTLEPRAAAPAARLRVIERLSAAGVPVGVLLAPIIPALNDHEIERLVEAAAAAGAISASYLPVRLPREVADLFTEVAARALPGPRRPRAGAGARHARWSPQRPALRSSHARRGRICGAAGAPVRGGGAPARARPAAWRRP